MAIFDEAYQYVQDDVGRPEMEDTIKRRIQRATLFCHRIDFWKQDFQEQIHAFQYSQAVQVLNLNLYPRMRSIGYIRKFDPSANSPQTPDPSIFLGSAGEMFKEINPQNIFDGYGYDRRNAMYRSGSTIKLNSTEAIQHVILAWFKDPLLEPLEACDSWILETYPSLIAAIAKQRIFKDLGKDEEYRGAQEEALAETNVLLANNIRLAVLQQPG
jgi:hypothetical protein